MNTNFNSRSTLTSTIFLIEYYRKNYLLLPMSMITILLLLCWRASSSQVVKWLNVSRLSMQAMNIIYLYRPVMFSQVLVCPQRGVCIGGGVLHPTPPTLDTMGYGQRAGGTHPTGMHAFSSFLLQTINLSMPAFYGVEKRCNVQMCHSHYIRLFDICTFNTKWSIS